MARCVNAEEMFTSNRNKCDDVCIHMYVYE